ncbi:hypothetical protein V1478_009757 [Vespula squamosa]|uniref:NADH dehydrogenase subunit 6 n=1 Tax=Vespula squamosa TaxID=30214 RepID=A0ABD2AJZ3_VESSQ
MAMGSLSEMFVYAFVFLRDSWNVVLSVSPSGSLLLLLSVVVVVAMVGGRTTEDVGRGRAGQGRAEQGRAGQGRPGQDKARIELRR